MGNGQIKVNAKKAREIFLELRPLLEESPHCGEYYSYFGRSRGGYKLTHEGIARNYVRRMCEDASEYAQRHGISEEKLPPILQAFRNNGGSIRKK
jgi:hypothetical protein